MNKPMRNNMVKKILPAVLAAFMVVVFASFLAGSSHAALRFGGKPAQTDAAKPAEPTKPAEAPKPVEAPKPAEEAKPAEAPKSAEEAKPAEAPKPAEAAKPVEAAKPAEEPKKEEPPAAVAPKNEEAPKASAPAAAEAPQSEAAPKAAAKAEEETPEASAVAEESVKEQEKAGPLKVDSDPQGAKVFIDGEDYGVTPAVIEGLSSLPHELVLYHPTLGAFSKKLESGSGAVMIKLSGAAVSSGAGFLNIESVPPNARIDVDGKNVGMSPVKVPISAGHHTILMSKAGFSDKEITVNVAEKETLNVNERLAEKAGALLIIASPAEADIYLDNHAIGKSGGPLRIAEVAPGIHVVRVEKKGYIPWKRDNVSVTREKTETLLVSLYPEQNEANVRLYTEPEGARVWLDGKEVGVAGPDGVGFVTTKGAHILKMELNPALQPGYRPLQVSVSFEEEKVDFKGLPFKLPVIDEAFIQAQRLYERGEGQEAMSYLDRVGKDQPSYPESRVMMIDILKDLGRTSEIPAEFEKLFDRQIYRKNPILNLSMGYWSVRAASKAPAADAVKMLEKGIEALDRAIETVDFFPASERQALALKSYYYTGMACELLFDLTGDKKYVKKGAQSWELFFGRLRAGEETLGDDWIVKAKRHQTNLQYLEKKLGG